MLYIDCPCECDIPVKYTDAPVNYPNVRPIYIVMKWPEEVRVLPCVF